LGFGLVSLLKLQTDEFPEVSPPVVVSTIVYPGASPEQVEREVLEPIEEAIQSISGVKFDQRRSARRLRHDHHAVRVLQAAGRSDAGRFRDAIDLKRRTCPQEMESPSTSG
jgi:HAE1 family hydrophobic/amphiphilic exporter-1